MYVYVYVYIGGGLAAGAAPRSSRVERSPADGGRGLLLFHQKGLIMFHQIVQPISLCGEGLCVEPRDSNDS